MSKQKKDKGIKMYGIAPVWAWYSFGAHQKPPTLLDASNLLSYGE